jgi:hypothetical protein
MIIIQLTGGLGNQLFQYAFGRALSEKSGAELHLDISSYAWDDLRNYELSSFDFKELIASKDEIIQLKKRQPIFKDRLISKLTRKNIPYFRLSVINEPSFRYDENYVNYRNTNSYFQGYWQSESYFKQIRPVLLKELTLKNDFSDSANYYSQLIQSTEKSVSIHVRRGDYVSNSETTAFHGVCDINYYKTAIAYIQSQFHNSTFFVFSDDKEYVKEVFGNQINIIFVENIPFDCEEMLLMSKCEHNIIANSSFSWWGAWLNQNHIKKVIAPKRWFANIEMQQNSDDLIPEQWIKI